MTRHTLRSMFAPLGLVAAIGVGAAGTAGCEKEAAKAEQAAEKAGEAAEKAGEKIGAAAEKAGEKIGEAAERIGDRVGPASERAAERAAESARDAAAKGARIAAAVGADAAVTAAGVLRTGAVKAALLQDTTIDVSDVDVDTDQVTRRIVVKGRVRSAAVRDKVIQIARETAPGYTIDNELTIR
jgi:hypothetical protein